MLLDVNGHGRRHPLEQTHSLTHILRCVSPDQAAYYRVFCPQGWTFLSDLALGWYIVRNERFIMCCFTLFLHCLEEGAVVDN